MSRKFKIQIIPERQTELFILWPHRYDTAKEATNNLSHVALELLGQGLKRFQLKVVEV